MKQILFGDIKPQGRLRESIQKDMDGCIGHLEELAPSITREQKIYGEDRLTAGSEQAELGRKADEHHDRLDVPAQYMGIWSIFGKIMEYICMSTCGPLLLRGFTGRNIGR